jgi:uncharacterized protein YecE (DUF72 family)
MAKKPVHVGCSGFSYKHWRGNFYPEKLPAKQWLSYYSGKFPTVEINATFYRLPKEKAVKAWADQTPAGFLFAVKGSRYMTHVYRLGKPEGVERLWKPLAPLRKAGKLGPVLWQLPPNFERDDDRLEGFLAKLPEGRHCFEFRHASWFKPAVRKQLESHGASLVIAHDARSELPEAKPCGPVAYVRFHYGAKGRGGNYAKSEIEAWARKIAAWRSRREVFAYFNDDMRGFAPSNAAVLSASLH